MKWAIVFMLLIFGPKEHHDVRIPVSCLTADVLLKDCNVKIDPPKCRTAVIKYRSTCSVIVLQKGESQ
jgi:hypothetical protein